VAIIGLGLLGQFLVQLCRANGCRVIGIDLDPGKCALAVENGAEAACGTATDEALYHAQRASGGAGVDAVLLTVSTTDLGPVELAATLVRDRGRVVCLGNTAITLDWRTWFGKEIDFLFSRPIGYVRWTANRNMRAFLDLIAQGKLSVPQLITHRFPFVQAGSVFDSIARGELNQAVGIVFEYAEAEKGVLELQPRTLAFGDDAPRGAVQLGQIGAGNYAKSMLMPHFPSLAGLGLGAICTARGANAETLARRYGFRKATTDAAELLRDPDINAIMVATRHDSHARYAAAALEHGKHAYVEKPLALSEEQLAPIVAALAKRGNGAPSLWVGHNRRFSPLSQRVLAHFKDIPVRQVSCTVRSAGVPADSWYQDSVEGGGILFGDVCHFIDLAIYLAQSLPVEVSACATSDPAGREESWAITLRFVNGGIGVVHYVCGSERGLERERIEVLGGGRSAEIIGFRRLMLRGGRDGRVRLLQPDLGQKAMLQAMVAQFSGAPEAVDYTESFLVSTQALLAAQRSIAERRIVTIEPRFPFVVA
jgi:polar amino acid transport system substrate-binding protein